MAHHSFFDGAAALSVHAVAHDTGTAHLVRIRAVSEPDRSDVRLRGLGGDHAWHARDRLRAALVNSGLVWPEGGLTLTVAGHELPVGDSGLDLAFVIAVLATSGQLSPAQVAVPAWIGELGLDGSLRPVRELPARAYAIARAGIPDSVVPAADLVRAVRVLGEGVRAAGSLAGLVAALRGGRPLLRPAAWPVAPGLVEADLADLPAAHPGRRAVEVAAAGGHDLALTGPVGCGGLMLAQRLPGLLPDLDEGSAAQAAAVYRAAGLLEPDAPIVHRPPWQAPHHTASLGMLLGTPNRPGALALAHGGVLLLDDAGELPHRIVEAVRGAMRAGSVVAVRGRARAEYSTRFQLVLTGRDCPGAGTHRDGRCDCPPEAVARYQQAMAPLLDQVDIRVALPAPPSARGRVLVGEHSHEVAARVARARAAAAARWARYGLVTNHDAGIRGSSTDVGGAWAAALTALRARPDARVLSVEQANRVLGVAWTLADLADLDRPGDAQLAEAIALRHHSHA